MHRFFANVVVFVLFASPGALAAVKAASPVAPAPPAWERYEIVNDRNVFNRDRKPVVRRTSSQADSPDALTEVKKTEPLAPTGPHDPGDDFALAGVAQESDGFVAFIEDLTTSTTKRHHVGDTLGGRTLAAITLDDVRCQADGKILVIAIGQTLTGAAPLRNEPPPPAPKPLVARKRQTPDAKTGNPDNPNGPAQAGKPGTSPAPEPGAKPATPTGAKSGASPATSPAAAPSDPASVLERLRQRREQELNR
jgi:hypothetical protein